MFGALGHLVSHLVGLGLQHEVGLLVDGQVIGVLLVQLAFGHKKRRLFGLLLQQVVPHGREQIVQLVGRLLLHLDKFLVLW